MVTKNKITKKGSKKELAPAMNCEDNFCPFHGNRKLKLRGRIFEGRVTKKLHGRVTIQFERMLKIPKYERYEKRKTKIHARLPSCMEHDVSEGDLIQIGETRPISKMIHFVVTKIILKKNISAETSSKGGKK
jgi:small subunit ribosomal protein S17